MTENEKQPVINYRKIYQKPIILYRLGKARLPFGIALNRVGLMLLIGGGLFCIQITLGHLVPLSWLFSNSLFLTGYYGLSMWFGSGFLAEERALFDGKNVFSFLRSLISYWWELRRKKVVFNDERPIGNRELVTFKESELIILVSPMEELDELPKEGSREHAIKETV